MTITIIESKVFVGEGRCESYYKSQVHLIDTSDKYLLLKLTFCSEAGCAGRHFNSFCLKSGVFREHTCFCSFDFCRRLCVCLNYQCINIVLKHMQIEYIFFKNAQHLSCCSRSFFFCFYFIS